MTNAVKAWIVRYFLGKRLARFLPGGWIALLLMNPISKRILRRVYDRWVSRRARTFHRRAIPGTR
jgi:predicted DCC family thiol-disulfide oxidoreductase YuxK